MTTVPTPTRREADMEIALRLQKLELEMEALTSNLEANTKATQDLLVAWQGSKFTVNIVKKSAAIGLFLLAIVAAWQKAKEGL